MLRLLRSGQRPTADRVRAEIGQGAQQTILAALDEFWTEIGERLSEPRLPESLVDSVMALWTQAVSAADQNWRAERTRFEGRVSALERQGEELRQALAQEAEGRERSEACAAACAVQVEELRQENSERAAAYQALRAEADQAMAEAGRVGNLLQAERDARERDQAVWLTQIDAARQAAKALQVEKENVSKLLGEAREASIRQSLQLSQWEQRAQEAESALQARTKERDQARAQSATMARRLERLDAELSRCSALSKEREQQVRAGETAYQGVAEQLHAAQLDKEGLVGENRALREELTALRATRGRLETSLQRALEHLQAADDKTNCRAASPTTTPDRK